MYMIEILALIVNLAVLVGFVFVYFKVRKTLRTLDITESVEHTADVFVDRAMMKAGMFDKNAASTETRRSNAVDTAIAQDIYKAHPLGAALNMMLPTLTKKITKNPELMPYAMQALNQIMGTVGKSRSGGDNGHTEDTPLNLGINLGG